MKTAIPFPGFSLAVLFMLLTLNACKKKEKEPFVHYTFIGDGSGSQVVPSVTTNATATFKANYTRPTYKLLAYTVFYKDLSGPWTKISIHGPASPGTNAPEITVADGDIPATTGQIGASYPIRDSQVDELLGGLWYYIIHTEKFPEGEVRGQIIQE